ncbi:MAG TPA: YqaE/Pmp3 family membrane protein [Bacillota bacterium]|nr:YqaE/Pmp3 family membrane protein [Bacillota bacterium]
MLYLLAIIFPPLAVLLVGKPIQALLNLVLSLIFWLPGVIHAILVVNEAKADKRAKNQLREFERINQKE